MMMQQDQTASVKADEQRKERLEDTRTSGVKGGSKKAKENEIRQEKLERTETTTVRSPPPPSTTTTSTTTTTTETPSAVERESEALMMRPSTGRIKGRLMDMSEGSVESDSMTEKAVRMERERELPESKISIHQLISQAMPTLQMSVVPIYFMNKATRTVMAVPYLVMKSVSKMPLIPGMVDALSSPSMSGAQNLMSFAMNKMQRSGVPPAMLALKPSVTEKASSVNRESESQVLEAGVEEARGEDQAAQDTASPSASGSHSDNNWVTIDSPASPETLDNTWFKR